MENDWKKTYVPIERRGDDALVMHARDDGTREYIVAHGYDEETGHWGHGTYYESLASAAADLEGRAISDTDGIVLADFWTREDIANALGDRGFATTDENIDAVLEELGLDGKYPYSTPFMESLAMTGNEAIADAVSVAKLPDAETRRKVPLDEQPQSVTLKGEAKDMQAARDTQNHAAFALHTGREDR